MILKSKYFIEADWIRYSRQTLEQYVASLDSQLWRPWVSPSGTVVDQWTIDRSDLVNHPEVIQIVESCRLPIEASSATFTMVPPGCEIPWHTDMSHDPMETPRSAVLVAPISTHCSPVVFQGEKDQVVAQYACPLVINATIPHMVRNQSNDNRLTVNFSINVRWENL